MSNEINTNTEAAFSPLEVLIHLWEEGPHSLCVRWPGEGFEYLRHHHSPDELLAETEAVDGDVWWGVNPTPGAESRGGNHDVASAIAAFCDLDWKDSCGHASDELPTEEEVRSVLAAFPFSPTVIVDTGGGVQPYWKLSASVPKEEFERCQDLLRAALEAEGLHVEATDAARVLRVPGTMNHKYDPPRPVTVSHFDPQAEITLEILEEQYGHLIAEAEEEAKSAAVAVWGDASDVNSPGGPISDYNVKHSIDEELVASGWDRNSRFWSRTNRPNGLGQSARIWKFDDGNEILMIYSTSPDIAVRAIAKKTRKNPEIVWCTAFDLFAVREHNGDVGAATEAAKTNTAAQSTAQSVKQQVLEVASQDFTGGRDAGERTYLAANSGPNVALYGKNAKDAVAGVLYEKTGVIAGRTPIDEAFAVIDYRLRKEPKVALPLRVGTDPDGATMLDLGDETGRAIVLDGNGWRIVPRSPITFARTRSTWSIPEPAVNGDINRIFEIVNVEPDQQRLVIGWLVANLIEKLPHPIVVLRGEQGSAKSTGARALATLIDPTAAPLLSPPKDDDRWDASCSAHWIVSVDNVSKVPVWWSDALCRVVTGVGNEKRALYTDGDVHVTTYRRCVILNGIALSGMMRTDLLERSIAFDFRRPSERKTEAEVQELLIEILPGVVGGLLDLASKVIAAEVPRPKLPRMADFGLILAKVDAVLGPGPSAVDAYVHQLEELFEESLESDEIAKTTIEFMENHDQWTGSTADLLRRLNALRVGPRIGTTSGWWPDNPSQLSHALTRSAPLLRSNGIEVENRQVGANTKRQRGKHITKRCAE